MRRISAVVDLLDSHAGSHLKPGVPADDALLELLGHMAIRDDVFDEAEIDLLAGVLPGWNATALHAWLGRVASSTLDFQRIATALATDDQRWTALRWVGRMALADGHLDEEELVLLEELASTLELPGDAVRRVLGEERGRTATVSPEEIETALTLVTWDAVDFAQGDVESRDLRRVRPPNTTPVWRVGVDGAEVLGLYCEGLVARFLEGPAWISWDALVGTSRGAGLESSVRLHTDDGRIWSLVDARMGGLTRVVDRLRGPQPTASGAMPVIERIPTPVPDDTSSDGIDDGDEDTPTVTGPSRIGTTPTYADDED